jgi:U3 small nucleolar RNA-associated protein 14
MEHLTHLPPRTLPVQPLGRQYNPDQSFKDMVRPAVLKNTGVIINPIKYAKSVEKTAQEVTAAKDKPKVIRVAGGAVVQAKKAKKQ